MPIITDRMVITHYLKIFLSIGMLFCFQAFSCGRDGRTLEDCSLITLIKQENDQKIEKYLDQKNIHRKDTNLQDKDGYAPLHWAAAIQFSDQSKQKGIIKLLIDKGGADVNARDCNGLTPLHWAARAGNGPIIEQLLAVQSVMPNMPDHRGYTPFHYAVVFSDLEMVKCFVRAGHTLPMVPITAA